MKKIEIDKLNKLIDNYPYLYLPYLIKLSAKDNEYVKNLNSLALRHPNRDFLKKFINTNKLNRDFIDDFINKNPKILKKKKNGLNNEYLALKRISQKVFITENMAEIYIKQNKIKEAIKIYEKLISLNSKKKSYFAKKIKNLKV
jgi:tetratricopeptide (TPR) repeat protein